MSVEPGTSRRYARAWVFGAGIAALAVAVLAVVLLAGGGAPRPAPAGVPDAGPVTGWGLPLARLVADLAGVLTVGLVLAAAALLPTRLPAASSTGGDRDAGSAPASEGPLSRGPTSGGQELLSATGLRCMRTAARAAALWTVAASVEVVLTFSDFLGVPPRSALDATQLYSFVTMTTQGEALAAQAGLALLVAVAAPWVLAPRGAVAVLAGALAALVPPALAGHSAAASDHMLATSSLLVHLVAAALWVGGLAALALVAVRATGPLLVAVPRFSRMAAWCVVAVAASGVVNALLRLGEPSNLVTTGYGRLVLAKVTALGVLACIGWLHRRRTLPALARDRARAAFARLAAVEVAVMTATVALAVGLGRTPTPVPRNPSLEAAAPARLVLGYDLPPAPTLARLLFDMRPDGFALTFAALAAALYLTGVRVLRRRGDAWPPGRTLAWLTGLGVLVFVTCGGLGRYAPVLFSAHMVQHMVLNMVVPLLLVLAAPVTLALRTLPTEARRGQRGPRDVLLAALHSPALRVLAHPLVASALFVTSLYALYFTPLFAAAMRDHWGHLAMQVHFVLAGALFFWVLIGVDPGPRRPPYPLRVLVLFLVMAFHAFFSVALMSTTSVFASGYYASLQRPWGGTALADQRLGGGIGWAFGEIPTLLVLAALFVQWMRADERAARAADRAADRAAERAANRASAKAGAGLAAGDVEEDELGRYNAYLAALHARAQDGADPPKGRER